MTPYNEMLVREKTHGPMTSDICRWGRGPEHPSNKESEREYRKEQRAVWNHASQEKTVFKQGKHSQLWHLLL